MIRYSSYGVTNGQIPSAVPFKDPLESEYRKLLELRERVRKAEAAAERSRRNPLEVRHISSCTNKV